MSIREIVLDTETTGLSPKDGHRIIEIGAVELKGRIQTGVTFQEYINPDRDIEQSAIRVHGITNESVRDCPKFEEVAQKFLAFIGDAPLVIHNAPFDMGFLNHELERMGLPEILNTRIDTLPMARKKYPGARVSLDALCQRYGVDVSVRTHHGALLDSQLLAEVYLELTGGLQPDLMGGNTQEENDAAKKLASISIERPFKAARSFEIPPEELEAHQAFIDKIENAVWTNPPTSSNKASQ